MESELVLIVGFLAVAFVRAYVAEKGRQFAARRSKRRRGTLDIRIKLRRG